MKVIIDHIRLVTLFYIAFPLLPFFGGWVRLEFAIPLILLLGLGCFQYYNSLTFKENERFRKRDIWVGIAIVSFWLLFSGAGGMGFQFDDHNKNNTLTWELSNNAWPLEYMVDGDRMYLSHYLSYYIMGPFLAGFIGYMYAQAVVFLWTGLGVFLGLFWLARATKNFNWRFFLFVIFFGGVALFSFVLKYKSGFMVELFARLKSHGYVFWMNGWDVIPVNYMGITDMLYWTPQHFIPALLGVGLILNMGLIDKNIKYLPFILSLLAMWSPLILVGLFPFFLYVLWTNKMEGIFNYVNLIIAPLLFGVLFSYLLAIDSGELIKQFIFSYVGERHSSLSTKIVVYFYFILFEVLVWVIPIVFLKWRKWEAGEKPLFLLTCIVLILVPLYRFGLWNDWCTRVSVPALLVLLVYVFKTFMEEKSLRKYSLVVILILSSLGATMDLVGSIYYSGFKPKFAPPTENQVKTLPEICISFPITQFVAKENTFFFKYLARKK
jgi:hypothetical protein